MAEENRLQRLEVKVDEIKDDLSDFKSDFKLGMYELNTRMEVFADHIEGDNKIIDHIEPLLKDLPSIKMAVEDYKFQKKKEIEKIKRRKKLSWTLGSVSFVFGIAVAIKRIFFD